MHACFVLDCNLSTVWTFINLVLDTVSKLSLQSGPPVYLGRHWHHQERIRTGGYRYTTCTQLNSWGKQMPLVHMRKFRVLLEPEFPTSEVTWFHIHKLVPVLVHKGSMVSFITWSWHILRSQMGKNWCEIRVCLLAPTIDHSSFTHSVKTWGL